MTYGVPYSFVPGTKARADEVNANFIDVLTKIEETNTKLEDAKALNAQNLSDLETQLETKITNTAANCSDLSLSNLNDAGMAVLKAKANASDLDGKWVKKEVTLLSSVTLAKNSPRTVSVSSYLPNDGKIYEVKYSLWGTEANMIATTQFENQTILNIGSNYANFGLSGLLVVGTDRKITFNDTIKGGGKLNAFLKAYRQVR